MNVLCNTCGRIYDDAKQWTICNHGPLWGAPDAYCRQHDLVDCHICKAEKEKREPMSEEKSVYAVPEIIPMGTPDLCRTPGRCMFCGKILQDQEKEACTCDKCYEENGINPPLPLERRFQAQEQTDPPSPDAAKPAISNTVYPSVVIPGKKKRKVILSNPVLDLKIRVSTPDPDLEMALLQYIASFLEEYSKQKNQKQAREDLSNYMQQHPFPGTWERRVYAPTIGAGYDVAPDMKKENHEPSSDGIGLEECMVCGGKGHIMICGTDQNGLQCCQNCRGLGKV